MKNVLRAITVFYTPKFPAIVVYMLQNTEYQIGPYMAWFWRTQNFARVIQRRELKRTLPIKLLLLALYVGILAEFALGGWLIYIGHWRHATGGLYFGLALIFAAPIVWAHLIVLPLLLGRLFFVAPNERRLIRESEKLFAQHKGKKIAIAGSYGKTSMKELLTTVLQEGLTIAATPGNKNVSVSHAYFARTLTGKEDVVIIEYGEGAPGDIARFARTTHPTHAIITGLAPAHLDHYPTLEAAGQDIFSLVDLVKKGHVYVNGDSETAQPFFTKHCQLYTEHGALGWKVSNSRVAITGISFTLKKGSRTLRLHSGLLGRHQLGPLSLVAALALEFGMNEDDVVRGIAATQPFEHRMHAYLLASGWVIDDTYNGNIEGIRAGTALLKELSATRKVYVTPGLVDQGVETERVHTTMGKLIADANPDMVVLMKNSTTEFIRGSLLANGYQGEIRIEAEPLKFYTNLPEFLAAGDLLMMQNDWPDNYA